MRVICTLIAVVIATALASSAWADCGCSKQHTGCGCAKQATCGCAKHQSCGCKRHKCGDDVELMPTPQQECWDSPGEDCCPRAEYTTCCGHADYTLLCQPKCTKCEEPKCNDCGCNKCDKCRHKNCGCGKCAKRPAKDPVRD